ncbi:MAG: maleylpyruvate isomerase family mycothiol-dependent enzyme [Propionibacteriales bacterium]|nr:maleylpyruvate isomerase family mycothiol-dependent enzyme [Propionibacteriales bacterium]
MNSDTAWAMEACKQAYRRLFTTLGEVDDDVVRRPSRLPDWTVGHVLTHLARNADGHAHRLEGALRGEDVPRYPRGYDERNREIEEGAGRPAREQVADVRESADRLTEIWRRCEAAGWPNSGFLGNDGWPTTDSPPWRLREIEVHHVDLGLGYEATDWPEEYVRWDLPNLLETVPERLAGPEDTRRFLAWLTGRSELPHGLRLGKWR